ncbi:benzoate/H(+) symporter BenE family transporter [Belnapia rosea]|uniref:Benzoate membrane transport protein n=1 Tax=Belnapia rosea TaxID=938405 RepID=A0A1G6KXR4_9PROT|nr:benzoate/H(+) symporter BenE family transporter [Belnapia rosea]SDC35882.1 benzoate membrane transport protein [Belnapia rosea]
MPSLPALAAGLLAGFVGFASSFAVVLQGLSTMGAGPAEAASGLMALSMAMGLCGIVLSLWRRMPISVAWSTPGAALLAASATPEGGFPVAVGAFLISGALLVLAGLWRPFGRAVASIPAPLASAMLAGVLLGLCLAPVRVIAEAPWAGLAIILAWALVGRFNRLLAVPAALAVAGAVIAATVDLPPGILAAAGPVPVWIAPRFTWASAIGIALPLFIVTMASQNIPGMAVLTANGYRPEAGPLFAVTGLFTLAGAPLGGHAVNLAAITAALCASPEAEPDPSRRWWAAVVAGLVYVGFGLLAGAAVAFMAAAPPVLIQAVAGLALLGAFGNAMHAAVAAPAHREAAIITFVVTASGLSIFGISGAFWGLLAGGAMLLLHRLR